MSTGPADTPQRAVFSVSQLNRLARETLEDGFPMIWVSGELSNFARPASGHWYFTLKDDAAQVRCAMFRNRNFRVRFAPNAGQQVLVKGRLSLYEARGDYQLIAEEMEPAGAGALALAFEQLKERLAAEGLFDPTRKRPLPTLPRHIVVVTSATGAAIRDILTVLKRRFPAIRVTLIPTAVQGPGAADGIVAGIELANRAASTGAMDFELILTGRGGGSLEDLWPFNEERVARAIYASALPVISAVGHEVDTSIADFVADARAPTPSAAAEMLSPDQDDWRQTLDGCELLLRRAMQQRVNESRRHLTHLAARLRHPGERLREQRRRLRELRLRLLRAVDQRVLSGRNALDTLERTFDLCHPRRALAAQRARLEALRARPAQELRHLLERKRWELAGRADRLQAISPLATLGRGYAILLAEDGAAVRDARVAKRGQSLTARLARGALDLEVRGITDKEENDGK